MKHLFYILILIICFAGNALLFAQTIEHKDKSIIQPKKEGPKYAMQKVSLIKNAEFEVIDILKEWDNLPEEKRNDFIDEVQNSRDFQEFIMDANVLKFRKLFLNTPTKENAHNLRETVFEYRRNEMKGWSEQKKQLFKENLPGNNHGIKSRYLKKEFPDEEGPMYQNAPPGKGGNKNSKKGGGEDEAFSNSACFITDRPVAVEPGLDLGPSIAADGNGNLFMSLVNTDAGTVRVYKSTDGGYTWEYKIGYSAESDWTHVRIDGNNYIYVTFDFWATPTNCDIYIIKSIDGGNTWTLYTVDNSGDDTNSNQFAIDGNNYLYIVYRHWDTFWGGYELGWAKSTNGGVSWTKDFDGVENLTGSSDYTPGIDAGFGNYIYCVYSYEGGDIEIRNSSNGTAWSTYDVIENCFGSTNYHMPSVAASKDNQTVVVVWTDEQAAGDEAAQRDYSTTGQTISTFGNNVGYVSGSASYDELFPRVCWSSDYWAGTANYFFVVYLQRGVSQTGAFYTKFAYATEAAPGTWTNNLDVSDGQNTNGDYLGSIPAITSRKGTSDANKYPAIAWADNRGSGPPNIYYSTYGRNYTIASSPAGLTLQVDGSPVVAPQTYDWPAGVSHSLNASPSPQSGYIYSSWSDAGAQSHSIVTTYGCPGSTTITANFVAENKAGYWTSSAIDLNVVAGGWQCGTWQEAGWTQTLTTGTVTMELCDGAGTPIPGWTSTQAGSGAKTWDISALSNSSYQSIRLRANLSGATGSAIVNNWYCKFSTVGTSTEYVWNGSSNTNWNNAGNWCGGGGGWPNNATKDVRIKSNFGTSNIPNANDATASCNNLTAESWPSNINISLNLNVAGNVWIQSGAVVDHLGGTITLAGDWRQDGGYNRNVSTTAITLTGAAKQIYGTNGPYWGNLIMSGTSSYTINGPFLRIWTTGGAGGTITFNAGSGLNANGKPMEVKGNWTNNGASSTFTSAGNTVTFNGAIAQTITSNGQTFGSVTIDNSATGTSDVTISDNMSLNTTGILTLTNGLLNTGANIVIINNTTGIAVALGSGNTNYSNSWINGNLRRYIANNTDVYDFPVGVSTISALAQLKNGNLTGGGFLYLDAKFNSPFTNTGSLDPDIAQDFGTSFNDVATEGEWQIDANASPISGNYDLYVYFLTNFAGLADNQFAILKRPSSSTDAATWVGDGSGTLNANGGAGRMVADLYALRKGMTGFSKFGIGKSGVPLPIELLRFDAKYNEETGDVDLDWVTASEINNDYFTVERSVDAVDFEKVVNVTGAGNSSQILHYDAVDEDPYSGVSYYRLKQTDYDGKYEYSKIVAVTILSKADLYIYPNPANTHLTLLFSDEDGDVPDAFIEIFDAQGKLIYSKNHETSLPEYSPVSSKEGKGIRQINISLSSFSQGMYFITFTTNNTLYKAKFVKEE